MFRNVLASSAALAVVASLGTGSAHHSYSANYDGDQLVTLEGVVTAYDFSNPHLEITLDVIAEDGSTTTWTVDGPGPGRVSRRGIDQDILGPSMAITVSGWPVRDGSSEIGRHELTLPDGTIIVLRDSI